MRNPSCRPVQIYEASARSGCGASAVTHAERTKGVVTAVSAVGPADRPVGRGGELPDQRCRGIVEARLRIECIGKERKHFYGGCIAVTPIRVESIHTPTAKYPT